MSQTYADSLSIWVGDKQDELAFDALTTASTAVVYPNIPQTPQQQLAQQLEKAKLQLRAQELAIRQEELKQTQPFDETEDFRDYVVWLCGYTERHEPPCREDWEKLREETKKMAAKFALATRARRNLSSETNIASTYKYATNTISSAGIAGDVTLTGNEELI